MSYLVVSVPKKKEGIVKKGGLTKKKGRGIFCFLHVKEDGEFIISKKRGVLFPFSPNTQTHDRERKRGRGERRRREEEAEEKEKKRNSILVPICRLR